MNTRESNNYNRGIMQIPTISYQLSPSSKFKKPLYTCVTRVKRLVIIIIIK